MTEPREHCELCGETEAHIVHRKDGSPPICRPCYQRTWKPPVATCSHCGQRGPCHNAATDRPLCRRCLPRRTAVCVDCGRHRTIEKSAPHGPLCAGCYRRAKIFRCRSCKRLDQNWSDGQCPSCFLAAEVERARAAATDDARERLDPYLQTLSGRAQPRSVLEWMNRGHAWATVGAMLAGEREISHETLDDAPRRQPHDYLRADLVACGVLEARNEPLARFARWSAAKIAEFPDHPDRAHLARYANWKLHRDLAMRTHAGIEKATTNKHVRRKLSVALMLTDWAHAQGLALGDLRQEHVDEWLTDAPSRSLPTRAFLTWAHRHGVVTELTIQRPAPRSHADPLDAETRIAQIRRLLQDEDIELAARVAGCLVLLLGQRVTNIVALRHEHVIQHGATVSLVLGRDAVELPEPLDALVLRLRDSNAAAGWLFPGAKPGLPLGAARMQRRLLQLEIPARASRVGALLSLAGTIPAPVLADLLGYCDDTASAWRRAAAGDWARYAALASTHHDADTHDVSR